MKASHLHFSELTSAGSQMSDKVVV